MHIHEVSFIGFFNDIVDLPLTIIVSNNAKLCSLSKSKVSAGKNSFLLKRIKSPTCIWLLKTSSNK